MNRLLQFIGLVSLIIILFKSILYLKSNVTLFNEIFQWVGIFFTLLSLGLIVIKYFYGKEGIIKGSSKVIIGGDLIQAINKFSNEFPNTSPETNSNLIGQLVYRFTRVGVFMFFTALLPTFFLVIQVFLLNQQNTLFKKQNEKIIEQTTLFENQNEKIDVQIKLEEANRRSSLILMMSNIMDKMDEEFKNNPINRELSPLLIGRIAALSQSFRPYLFLDKDTLTKKSYSPERGQLLIALVNSNLDTATYDKIYQLSSFQDAYLVGAEFRSKYLKGVNLKGANLSNANFRGADLSNANLSDVILNGINLRGANLKKTLFDNVVFKRYTFFPNKITGSSFRGADLNNIHLTNLDLSNIDFRNANLQDVNMSNINITGVNFHSANLCGITLNKLYFNGKNIDSMAIQLVSKYINKRDSILLNKDYLQFQDSIYQTKSFLKLQDSLINGMSYPYRDSIFNKLSMITINKIELIAKNLLNEYNFKLDSLGIKLEGNKLQGFLSVSDYKAEVENKYPNFENATIDVKDFFKDSLFINSSFLSHTEQVQILKNTYNIEEQLNPDQLKNCNYVIRKFY